MFVTSHDGTRLHVSVEGDENAPAILFSHNLGGDLHGFDGQAEAFKKDYRVIRFDTRGHGQSDAPDKPYALDDLGRDALAILDALGIEQVDYVGVSQGGMTGMWLAVHAPDRIRKLVLANTTPFIPNKPIWDEQAARARAEGMDRLASETITSWVSEAFRETHPEKLKQMIGVMADMPVAGFAGNVCVLRDVDMREELPKIAMPVLVIGGAEDGPRGAALPIMTAAVQNGTSYIIDGAAHLSHIENTDAFNKAVLGHLIA